MKVPTLVLKRQLLTLLLVLPFAACAEQDSGTSDTAVHQAEAQQGEIGEIMARGETIYLSNCAACHQPTGTGLAGAFPPLAESDFLTGSRKEVLSTALFGRSGPMTVNGQEYDGVMPSMGYLSDQDLADVLTYVLGSWGNTGAAVSVAEVAALRVELGQEDRATGERHTGTSEAEMRYQAGESTITSEDTRQLMSAGGPVLSAEEFQSATQIFDRAPRRVSLDAWAP